jgi:hypothetical protein
MSKRKNLIMLFGGLLMAVIYGINIYQGEFFVMYRPVTSGYNNESTEGVT